MNALLWFFVSAPLATIGCWVLLSALARRHEAGPDEQPHAITSGRARAASPVNTGIYYYLNNCQNLDHRKLYGGNAFYDLWTRGRDDEFAKELQPGDTCLVASYHGMQKHDRGKVAFARFTFTGRRRVQSSEAPGGIVWVLDGILEQCEVLPKSEATKHDLYSRFFDQRGHFKQVSVLRGARQAKENRK